MPTTDSDSLTATEAALLKKLATHPEAVVSYDVLERVVWSSGGHVDRQQLQNYVSRLRKKIEPTPGVPFFIITRRLVGYAFFPKGFCPQHVEEAVAGVARLTGMGAPQLGRRKLHAVAALPERATATG
jgi:DNA-binding winged helix-turn-helix (wHTH) protein